MNKTMRIIQDPAALEAILQHPAFLDWFGSRYNDRVQAVCYEAGEHLIEQENAQGALFLLMQGKVRISTLLPNGKHRILTTENALALLGEVELLQLNPPLMTVRAMTFCRAALLPYALCREQLLGDAAFLRRLALQLSRKERRSVERLMLAFSYPLENRLARFILEMQEERLFPVRKVEAADMLGVSYRHLSQVLGVFVKAGYLEKSGLRYEIKNPEALLRLSQQMEE